ncbi:MAG: hypothetical protein JO250_01180 [Armatimonadetes bacterium]|nr:hypothetical protein [Armatimonadota bacterium]
MSWWRRLRQHLSLTEGDGRLVIQRNWEPHAFGLSLYALFVVASLWASGMTPAWQFFLRHHADYVLFLRLFYGVLLVAPVAYAHRLSLRLRTFVFDRAHDYVTCNGRVVCALSELESVRVGKPLGADVDGTCLGFLIHGRNEIVIDRNDFLGAGTEELGRAGLALAVYAGVPLSAEGTWSDPSHPPIVLSPDWTADVVVPPLPTPPAETPARRLRRPRRASTLRRPRRTRK